MYRSQYSLLHVFIALTLGSAGLFLVAPAHAQKTPDMTVFGIAIGQSLAIPDCEKVSNSDYVSEICIGISFSRQPDESVDALGARRAYIVIPRELEQVNAEQYGLDGGWFNNSVVLINDAPEQIRIGTQGDGNNQEKTMVMLVNKYGKPTNRSVQSLQNACGATFSAIHATWRFKTLTVEFYGRINANKGLIEISTPRFASYLAQKENQQVKGKF